MVLEKRRIEREEKETEEAVAEAQRVLSEKLARLFRLRRQKEQVLLKAKDMVARGLRDLDELERVECEESEAVIDVQVAGAVDVIDWSAVFGTGELSGVGPLLGSDAPIPAAGEGSFGTSQ